MDRQLTVNRDVGVFDSAFRGFAFTETRNVAGFRQRGPAIRKEIAHRHDIDVRVVLTEERRAEFTEPVAGDADLLVVEFVVLVVISYSVVFMFC